MRRRTFSLAMMATLAVGCSPRRSPEKVADPKAPPEPPPPPVGSLEWAIQGPWRIDPDRDEWRHPLETLRFFGLAPGMTVVEVFPGRGWYTTILAPYLHRTQGKLYVATFDPAKLTPAQQETLEAFDRRFEDADAFGAIERTVLSANSRGVAPEASVDLILLARNVHTLLGEGYAEKAFADFFRALKPGGALGVEQHRAPSTGLQDPQASTGYVQEAFVKLLAQEAGFEFVSSSEINANPRDDRDHPFGVWTLPPTLRTAPLGHAPDRNFDVGPYLAVGESDRMTLKFRRPVTPPAAAAPPAEPPAAKGKRP